MIKLPISKFDDPPPPTPPFEIFYTTRLPSSVVNVVFHEWFSHID